MGRLDLVDSKMHATVGAVLAVIVLPAAGASDRRGYSRHLAPGVADSGTTEAIDCICV
jgi:hypothetical protein